MFNFLLVLATTILPMAAPPPPPTVTPLPEVVSVLPWGSDSVALFHADGGFTVASLAGLVIVNASPNAFGWPALGTNDAATGGAGPHVYETTYNSNSGSHTVRTPCAGYNSLTDCAQRHRAAVEALQQVYPRL